MVLKTPRFLHFETKECLCSIQYRFGHCGNNDSFSISRYRCAVDTIDVCFPRVIHTTPTPSSSGLQE